MFTYIAWRDDLSEDLPQTISGADLASFLKLFSQRANLMTFKTATWSDCVSSELRKALEPYLIQTAVVKKWFGYDYTSAPKGVKNTLEVQTYSWNESTRELILKYFDDVFMRVVATNGTFMNSIEDLEDFCLYADDDLVVGTVSHEYILDVNAEDSELIEALSEFGKWRL